MIQQNILYGIQKFLYVIHEYCMACVVICMVIQFILYDIHYEMYGAHNNTWYHPLIIVVIQKQRMVQQNILFGIHSYSYTALFRTYAQILVFVNMYVSFVFLLVTALRPLHPILNRARTPPKEDRRRGHRSCYYAAPDSLLPHPQGMPPAHSG